MPKAASRSSTPAVAPATDDAPATAPPPLVPERCVSAPPVVGEAAPRGHWQRHLPVPARLRGAHANRRYAANDGTRYQTDETGMVLVQSQHVREFIDRGFRPEG